jgi:hypothetical protein
MLGGAAATTMFSIVARSSGLGSAVVAHIGFVVGAVAIWPAVFDHRRPHLVAAVPLAVVFAAAVVAIVARSLRSREQADV